MSLRSSLLSLRYLLVAVALLCLPTAAPWLLRQLKDVRLAPWGQVHVFQLGSSAQQLRLQNIRCDMNESDWREVLRELGTRGLQAPKPHPLTAIKSFTPATDDGHCVATLQLLRDDGKIHDSTVSGYLWSQGREISFDSEFRDLTPLHWSPGWTVDIVGITGFGGRPIGSWQGAGGMWFRDWLGPDLQQQERDARIFTYGYPSKVVERGRDTNNSEYAHNYLSNLAYARKPQLEAGTARPLVMIGHSNGGLVIKEALILADKSPKQAIRDVLDSCVCIVMFAVPNLGLNNTSFLDMTENQENHELMRSMGRDSAYLEQLDKDFRRIVDARNIKIVVVYETKNTPSFEQVGENGVWSRSGPDVRSVPRDSAISPGLGENVEIIPSYLDHVGIAKLPSPQDPVYRQVRDNIVTAVGDATKRLAQAKFIGVPTQRAEFFVGGDHLSEIHRHFSTRNRPANGRIFVVRGGAGMGKTETALQYATTYAGAYSRVVWIKGGSEQEILQSFKSAAEPLDVEDFRDPQMTDYDPQIDVDLVLAKLSQANQKVLLIYDGLDDANLSRKIIDHHRPKWRGSMSIIVTTSYDISLSPEDRRLTLRGLESRDGIHLLHELLGPDFEDDDGILDDLGQAVGWSPLALRSIASLLKAQRYPVKTLLDTLKYSPMLVLEHGNPPCSNIQDCHVIRILKKSIERFRQDASMYTSKLLSLMSFLGAEVPDSLFEQGHNFYLRDKASRTGHHDQVLAWLFGDGSWTPGEMHMELSEPVAHNVIWHEEPSWKQQPLMGEVVRRSSAHPEEIIVEAMYLIHAGAEEIRKQHGGDATPDMLSVYHDQLHIAHLANIMIAFCHRVLKKSIATIVPLEHIDTIANWRIHAGQYQVAIDMLKIGIEQQSARGIDIADAPIVNKVRRTLALAFRRNMQLREADNEQQIAIRELEDVVSKDGNKISIELELIAAQGGLATIWRDRGRHEDRSYFGKSIKLGTQIVQEATHKLGEAHPRTLHEMSRLSTTYTWAGRPKKSLELNKEIHGLCVSNLPLYPSRQQRLECLRKLHHVSKTHFFSGEFDEAVSVGKEVVKHTRELQGDRHMETAEALNDLAISCYKAASVQGRTDTLLQLVTRGSLISIDLEQLQQVLAIGQDMLGWVISLQRLVTQGSWATIDLGQAQQALSVWQTVLRWWAALRGLVKVGSLTNVHLDLALEFIQEAIDIWEELLGKEHKKTKDAWKQRRAIVLAHG